MKAKTLLLLALVCVALPAIAQAPPEIDDRNPAHVMSYLGADWLERPTRDEEQQPDNVIAVMDLKPGDVVVDLGVGTGYFARRMAPKVAPEGKVLGVDIQQEMLDLLEQYCEDAGIENVVPILGTETDPKLPEGGVDWVLLVDVYHEFQQPKPMLEAIRKALKPDGRVALLEYRLQGDTAKHIKEDHRMSVPQVLAEWNPAGFELVDLQEFLPTQHFFIFKRGCICPEEKTPDAPEK
ncbi:MAG: methyltransferase domain-containing protein [Candidatus Hydrogenedens sp.]|nr:methyltransferase domain-containing protein [Candidatus Hydrogenedens sp.]